jgi:hypothetical protein
VATGATKPPGGDDHEQARRLGWPIGVTERSTATELVERAILAADRLDVDAVLGAFVAGVGASAPRGPGTSCRRASCPTWRPPRSRRYSRRQVAVALDPVPGRPSANRLLRGRAVHNIS